MTEEEYLQAHQDWFLDGKVSIDLLSDWRDNYKTELLHNFVETKITMDFRDAFGSMPAFNTAGYYPQFDVMLKNDISVEVKITSYNSPDFFIEVAQLKQGHWVDSGLTLSTSKFYIILQPGQVLKGGPQTLKVRIIPTKELRKLASVLKKRELNSTRGFDLSFKTLEKDGWVGSYPYNEETKVFDIMNPTVSSNRANKIKQDYEKDLECHKNSMQI